jgi:hypothetical protein
MSFNSTAKKINMNLSLNNAPVYYNNTSVASLTSGNNFGFNNGVRSVYGSRRVFSQGSMIEKISNIKNSGCSSCGGR